jgi:mannose-6-phosphate isomerase-like protein (cupin superfamily)
MLHNMLLALLFAVLLNSLVSEAANSQSDVSRAHADELQLTRILAYADSGGERTAIDVGELAAGGHLKLQGHPQERLYYFLDGRGIMSIYEEAPVGDVYELTQDTAIYMTPGIKHELINVGNTPLRFVVFLVRGGVGTDGEGGLSWGAVSQRGVTVDTPDVGAGVAVTRVFDEGSNPAEPEGLHLLIRDIWLRRPQKFSNAEVVSIAPGRSTRLHDHTDSSETVYVLYGEGNFVWDDRKIPFKAGDSISYPIGVMRRVENTGRFPMSYAVISAFVN